ncbi:MAG: hypothetical protein C0490_27030, partial [Marivirga sp.]|nr:hypothetical protein [Marivirga sp.]
MGTKIEKSNVEEIFELSMAQSGMLFHHLEDAKGSPFNVQIALEVKGPLDASIIRQSLDYVQSKNEVLRSVFAWEKISKPLQIILKEISIELDFHDLSKMATDSLNWCKQYLAQDRLRRFDLSQVPIRLGVIRLSHDSHLISVTHHHILYDGWSTGVFLKELFSSYDALLQGSKPILKEKPSYKEIQKSIQPKLKGQYRSQYWSNYLQGYEITNLTFDKKSSEEKEQRKVITLVDRDLNLDRFSSRYKVTKASIIYAAYGILLQKYLNTPDVVFGTAVSYREGDIRNAENVMGNYINVIPLRFRGNNDQSALQTVIKVHQELINRISHNYTSYFDIKQVLGLTPTEKLFDSVVVIENYPLDKTLQTNVRDY